MNKKNLESLVERARQKDPDAFGQLYDLYINKIYRYIFYRVGNQEEAEDLTGDVFTKAIKAIRQYKSRGIPFSAWLFRIAHNTVTDYYRTHSKQTGVEFNEEDERLSGEDTTVEQASARKKQEELRAALAKLTVDQQNVIILRFYAGFSIKEAASFLCKTDESIKALQHRAIKSLHRILGEDYQNEL